MRHNVLFIADPPVSVDLDIAIVSDVLFAANTYADRSSEPFETNRASMNEKKKARIPVLHPISLRVNSGIAQEEENIDSLRILRHESKVNSSDNLEMVRFPRVCLPYQQKPM
jgi:hypothetical protein